MTDLQKCVFLAIQGEGSTEEKTQAALNAVRMWYFRQGQFHDAYYIGRHNPSQPVLEAPSETLSLG